VRGIGDSVKALGRSLAGARNILGTSNDDIDVAPTPFEVVYRDGPMRLLRYSPDLPDDRPPLLVVYAVFNRYYMLDLQQNRSILRRLLDRGLEVYVVDWGYPDRSHQFLGMDDYVNGYLHDCVQTILDRSQSEAVDLLGICQGGAQSLCYAALHPERVRNLITMVTPVDFHAGANLVVDWIRAGDPELVANTLGILPGEMIALGFLARSPFERNLRKFVDLGDTIDDAERVRSFLRMEKWINDTPNVPGELFRQWITEFYQQNRLVRGELSIGGRTVDLGKLTMPVLNIYAEHDDLVPPASSKALAAVVGTDDYTERSFPVGHIGMYVSGKLQSQLPELLSIWLQERS
jgi:polyhydroxyalkanoate synthase